MKQLLLVLASVMCICYTTQSFAQTNEEETIIREESIILDDKDNEGETTIEIKNGKLYVDGKKVSDIDNNTKIKIVKKNTNSEIHNFDFDFDKMDIPFAPRGKTFQMHPRKAMLGVMTQDAKPGAEVKEVVEGSAAEKAGLHKGDIIVAIDDKNIESSQELVNKITEYKKGDEIKIQIERNGKAKNLFAQLEESKTPKTAMKGGELFSMPFGNLENLFNMPDANISMFSSSSKPKLGIEVEETENGIEVLSVKSNSAAEKAGLEKGDEIKTIEGKEIASIEELQKEIHNRKSNKKILIGVKRDGAIKSLPMVLPRAKRRAQF